MPERFAHGYQMLSDKTDTCYLVGEFYTPAAEGGFLYNDPSLAIAWPLPVTVVSDKDLRWPSDRPNRGGDAAMRMTGAVPAGSR